MKIGVSLPTMELKDPAGVREFAQGAESLGFEHLSVLEHVLGTRGAHFTPEMHNHEPLVLFGFLAGVTSTIILQSSILILPQRQTALVAKQAAEVDVLSNGRLRLGVGLGRNEAEAVGVGSDFHTRGARVEEQIDLMRKLWSQPVVTYRGRWHEIVDGGITVFPVQQPIPIWMGGGRTRRTLERIGRLADGWIAASGDPASWAGQIATIRQGAEAAGRDPNSVTIQGRISLEGDPGRWLPAVRQWQELGATNLSAITGGVAPTAADHLRQAERFLNEVRQVVGA